MKNMKNDPHIYITAKAIEYPRTIHDVTIEKIYAITKTQRSIIVTSQTSSLNTAIKTCKQPIIPVLIEDSRKY